MVNCIIKRTLLKKILLSAMLVFAPSLLAGTWSSIPWVNSGAPMSWDEVKKHKEDTIGDISSGDVPTMDSAGNNGLLVRTTSLTGTAGTFTATDIPLDLTAAAEESFKMAALVDDRVKIEISKLNNATGDYDAAGNFEVNQANGGPLWGGSSFKVDDYLFERGNKYKLSLTYENMCHLTHISPLKDWDGISVYKLMKPRPDISMQGLAEEIGDPPTNVPHETNPGAFICLNDNDDGAVNETEDKDDGYISPGSDDPDLVAATLNISSQYSDTGTLELTHGSAVKIYEKKNKDGGQLIGTGLQWDLSVNGNDDDSDDIALPITVYVEGCQPGDTNLELDWTGDWDDSGSSTITDTVKVTVVTVQSVVWEVYPDDVEVPGSDVDPSLDHGANLGLNTFDYYDIDSSIDVGTTAMRIYPGKKHYEDTSDETAMRRKVKVKATLNCSPPASSDFKIYFTAWDVDDPLADETNDSLDENDDHADSFEHSIDNRGSYLFSGGTTARGRAEISVTADGSTVEADFSVSMQPGDNYKATASATEHRNLPMSSTPVAGAYYLDNNKIETGSVPDSVKITDDMLTTWRKLHVEIDKMADVPSSGDEKNFVAGDATFQFPAGGNFLFGIDQDLEDRDMYENGTLLQGGTPYTVPSGSANTTGIPSGLFLTAKCTDGPFTSLKDDDTLTTLSYPSTAKLSPIFEKCLVECVYDDGGDVSWKTDNVIFDLNMEDTERDSYADMNRDSVLFRGPEYWVAYVLGAYQGPIQKDGDPDIENIRYGNSNDYASLIYLEAINDPFNPAITMLEQETVVHEVGHLFGLDEDYTNSNIMNASPILDISKEHFSDSDIDIIRGINSP